MKQETKQPLYKVLNEQRIKGTWQNTKDGNIILNDFVIADFDNVAYDKFDNELNCQYTVLAVNNLHHLAEALENLTKEINLSKLNIRKDFSLINAHAQALKALNRIS